LNIHISVFLLVSSFLKGNSRAKPPGEIISNTANEPRFLKGTGHMSKKRKLKPTFETPRAKRA
jgi:hypothetical protein